jgi:S1-C subfamily serine protease
MIEKRLILILIICGGIIVLAGFVGNSAIVLDNVKSNNPSSFLAQAVGLFDDFFNQWFKARNVGSSSNVALPNANSLDIGFFRASSSQQELSKPVLAYEDAVVGAVQSVAPSVVSIIISKNLPVIERCPYNPFSDLPPELRQFFDDQFDFSQPCQKGFQKKEVGGGTGFIVSSDGLIVTNKHVVLDEKAEYLVLTNDGKKHSAQVLARDPVKDLALIKISAHNLPVARLGDSSNLKLGQTAIAIGNALGEFRNTVSVGVISGLSRNIVASGGGFAERIEGLIQTDAAINQGNSGGPLVNLRGEVIGINVAMVAGAQNIGFAIPINQAKKAIESVKKLGKIVSPFLGVRYLVITEEMAKREKLPVEEGALIRGQEDGPGVVPNSPAFKAGLQAEDIILEVNGEKLTASNSLSYILQKYSVGDVINLKILRNGKEMNVSVKLEERPKEF